MNPRITTEGQKAKNRIAEFRQNVNNGATPVQARQTVRQIQEPLTRAAVSASELINPPVPVTVPEPQTGSIPTSTLNIARNVARDTNGFISAQTEEAKKLKELQATYGALSDQGSLSDLFRTTQAEYGATPEAIQELKDINLQLTDMQGESDLTKTRIEGAAGQTIGQSAREVTQEDREQAVRSATLASRAAVLQGNIQTATQLAKDAVNIAYQDRTLQATNLINQIEMVQGQVDDQTAQLLEQEKRQYEKELADIKEVKDAVSTAMVNGASQAEMSQLTDPAIDDATKLALAQSITARGANQIRNLEIEAQNANIANTYSQINSRDLADTISKAEKGDANAIAQLGFDPRKTTGNFEAESGLRKEFNGLKVVQDATQVQNSFNNINAAYNQALQSTQDKTSKAAADQALVISFNKMLDPGSVVREGEFARSTEGQALINKWQAKVEQVTQGGVGLTDTERASIVNLTKVLYADYIKTHNDKAFDYRQNAVRQGGDPRYVATYMDTVGLTAANAQEGDIIIKDGVPYQKQGDQMIELTDI